MKISSSSRPPLLPPKATSAKLFFVGSTVGPLVDSLHNQCLLAYDIAPLSLPNPVASAGSPLFCSSWAVPPLLGLAYIILGYILPRVIELLTNSQPVSVGSSTTSPRTNELKNKAILAVTSTAAIIKLSEYLQTHDSISLGNSDFMLDAQTNLGIMTAADVMQWIALDCTPVAFVAATITAIGGPLSELPFVAHGFWHYLPESANYLPLNGIGSEGILHTLGSTLLGEGFQDLSLSSITGPCYFAVTMDAIALGRYFYQSSEDYGEEA